MMKAAASGLDVIALTDHDTFDGLEEAQAAGQRFGVRLLPGLEMTCHIGGRDVHLLGYGPRRDDAALGRQLRATQASRTGRLGAMCEKLTEAGMPVTIEDVRRAAGSTSSLGRPHVADAMVAKGYVEDRNEAFRDWLADGKPAYVPRHTVALEDGIDLIHKAGGVAILAHPWGRGAQQVLTPQVIASLSAYHQLDGIEVEHQEHDQAARRMLFDLGGRLGLVRTGSSDYHGTGKKDHDLGCNLTRETAYREIVTRIQLRGGVLHVR
ncbi:PHP domain-containing protein [Cutibacterium equinum]|uniref:PHP domain-containing protein n=1 Tax=Cutibacterium equinum TaxID=3016342 RepID=A0ABY7R1E6_9ACTN|nr:PHP domain-containing protein [Cutibacterium equinum]WCC81103.1 PHP domain-containing protein [Cutibacterium equinum]